MTAPATAGELLRESRRRHGLTQAQLAARARRSQSSISRIERGLGSPSVATLAGLLDLMNEELVLDTRPVAVTVNRDVLRANLDLSPAARIDQGAFLANAIRGVITRADRFSPTLHSEIARVLVEGGNPWMSTKELADRVNETGLYQRSDRRLLKAPDIDARTQNYSSLFERRGRQVRLVPSAHPQE